MCVLSHVTAAGELLPNGSSRKVSVSIIPMAMVTQSMNGRSRYTLKQREDSQPPACVANTEGFGSL